MTIKNLVIGTGGIHIFELAGALYKLLQVDYIKYNEIENIYCTSAGCIIGFFFCLKTDWNDLIDYMIKNPWTKTFENLITTSSLFSALNEKGVLDKHFFIKILCPVLKSHGLKITITLKELYEYSKIKINIYAFNISTFKSELFNYETHPDEKILDVLYASCALPFIFKPACIGDSMYMDGGLKHEYPLNKCIEDGNDKETIIGIKIVDSTEYSISIDDNIFQLAYYLLRRFVMNNRIYYKDNFENEIIINCSSGIDLNKATAVLSNENIRHEWINHGKEVSEKFLLNKLIKSNNK